MTSTATTAHPFSYSKICDTFRPRVGIVVAARTDLGGKALINFLEPNACRNRLITEHGSERRLAGINDGLRHPCLCQCGRIHVANEDRTEPPDQAGAQFLMEILTTISNLRMDRFDLTASNLAHERHVLRPFFVTKGPTDVGFVSESGGSVDFERPKFPALMDAIDRHEVAPPGPLPTRPSDAVPFSVELRITLLLTVAR